MACKWKPRVVNWKNTTTARAAHAQSTHLQDEISILDHGTWDRTQTHYVHTTTNNQTSHNVLSSIIVCVCVCVCVCVWVWVVVVVVVGKKPYEQFVD